VFVVAHGHAMIREVCNRAIWMDKGVIKMDGETNAVLDAYEADVAEKKAAKIAKLEARLADLKNPVGIKALKANRKPSAVKIVKAA
jgi:ABC-type glutathione transport system ATPase component